MKKKSKYKKLPDFKSEEEEREFWKTHDVRDYINWDNAVSFVNRVFRDKKKSQEILKELKESQK
ncbi:MAG: BrnA antitoxin family protein [Proteobacteria bacterium]|nr:BrnA antitoxin family protein [Pseudomonadota bacterium]